MHAAIAEARSATAQQGSTTVARIWHEQRGSMSKPVSFYSEGAVHLRVLQQSRDRANIRQHAVLARRVYGIDAKLFEWSDEITADCPRKQARNLNDQCGARCPDLSKVV